MLCLGRHVLPGLPARGVPPAARGRRRDEESEDLEQEEADGLFAHRTKRSTLPTAIDVQARPMSRATHMMAFLGNERLSGLAPNTADCRLLVLALVWTTAHEPQLCSPAP